LVYGSVPEGIVAEGTMKQLHRYRTPADLYSAAGDVLHFNIRTS